VQRGEVPDPGGSVTEHDQLSGTLSAAPACFGVDQRAERIGRGEGGQIARAAVIADRPAVVVDAGLGEQAGELDLAGCGTPAGLLAGPALGSGGHAWHSGAVHRDVEGVDGLVADLELMEAAGQDRVGLGCDRGGDRLSVGFC
jgi:hypothetical protein